jgi:hypothetical protein
LWIDDTHWKCVLLYTITHHCCPDDGRSSRGPLETHSHISKGGDSRAWSSCKCGSVSLILAFGSTFPERQWSRGAQAGGSTPAPHSSRRLGNHYEGRSLMSSPCRFLFSKMGGRGAASVILVLPSQHDLWALLEPLLSSSPRILFPPHPPQVCTQVRGCLITIMRQWDAQFLCLPFSECPWWESYSVGGQESRKADRWVTQGCVPVLPPPAGHCAYLNDS